MKLDRSSAEIRGWPAYLFSHAWLPVVFLSGGRIRFQLRVHVVKLVLFIRKNIFRARCSDDVRNGTRIPCVLISNRKEKVVDETFRVLRIVGTLSLGDGDLSV
jgi:hypothetical protein